MREDTANASVPGGAEELLTGKNRIHFEGLGDAWGALTGRDPAAIMSQIAGTVLHAGGTRPVWQWRRDGREYVLMAWPQDQPARAAVLMAGETGGKLSPVTVVPLLDGLPNDLTVEESHPWERGHLANVSVSMIEGKNPLWFFNPLYCRDIEALREERDLAVRELASVKTALDEREIELLQMDEEMQREIARFEDERKMLQQERGEAEERLEKLASRVRELVSFLPESGAAPVAASYSED